MFTVPEVMEAVQLGYYNARLRALLDKIDYYRYVCSGRLRDSHMAFYFKCASCGGEYVNLAEFKNHQKSCTFMVDFRTFHI